MKRKRDWDIKFNLNASRNQLGDGFAEREGGQPMERLKPCPFCGAPVTIYHDKQDNTFQIFHLGNDYFNCFIIGSIMLDAVSLADAAKAWNRRADDGQLVHGSWAPCFDEEGHWRQGFAGCSNCGQEYYACAVNHFDCCPKCGAKLDGGVNDGESKDL